MNTAWLRDRWHRALAVITAAVGLALVIFGWVGVSGSHSTTKQLPYLASGGVGGLFALGVAATIWLSSDLREGLAKFQGSPPAVAGSQSLHAGAGASSGRTVPEGLVASSMMSRYHRASCALVAGKEVSVATRADQEAAGRQPCEVCWP
jgi:hypothetical protein